ncbi:hypothetical protein ACUY3K_10015 [Corynebacterium uberis]|uniref:hypothetical protein n=1 Tax=Corynebacterium TaxID=1716 RepID=UPI001D09BFDF|nr:MULTISPECIES: hypothetical protein [Corynebacterium]MCZ9309433.1 hypothetical protein [Corynebacterium sp. c6VSa_13]UDL72982.1 hypothetical protein LH391_07620 [Corynebacterium uberis]UDL76141.1 hypothetical protein LH393_01770 [Corynebacterium uberis]UDL78353.1 hypothetical protein LH394_01765 [Corynebacterium uberis]UDL80636.1 hypothetical protein LH392_02195 [Corynebacterium uberis]
MTTEDPIAYEDARAIADGITALDGVAHLHAGHFGEKALLFPGERIPGLHVTTSSEDDSEHLEVRVVADLHALNESGSSLHDLGQDIRRIAQGPAQGHGVGRSPFPVDVIIVDAVEHAEPQSEESESSSVATAVRRNRD